MFTNFNFIEPQFGFKTDSEWEWAFFLYNGKAYKGVFSTDDYANEGDFMDCIDHQDFARDLTAEELESLYALWCQAVADLREKYAEIEESARYEREHERVISSPEFTGRI